MQQTHLVIPCMLEYYPPPHKRRNSRYLMYLHMEVCMERKQFFLQDRSNQLMRKKGSLKMSSTPPLTFPKRKAGLGFNNFFIKATC